MNHQYQFLILFYFELNFQEFSKTFKNPPSYLLTTFLNRDARSIEPKIIRENPSSLLHNPNHQPKIVKIPIFRFNIFSQKKNVVTPNQLESFSNHYLSRFSSFRSETTFWIALRILHLFSANHPWKSRLNKDTLKSQKISQKLAQNSRKPKITDGISLPYSYKFSRG